MAKCRMLIQENEDLGKMTNSGRIAKLEGDLAVSRKLCDELKNSQTDVDAFLLELDESMEAMQSTAMALQCRVDTLQEENQKLKKRLLDAGLSIEEDDHHHHKSENDDDWSSPPPDKKIRSAPAPAEEDDSRTTTKTTTTFATPPAKAVRVEVVLENQPIKIEADERTLAVEVAEREISSPLCYEINNCRDNDEPEF
uniref:Uncharacterized protein n=1 Tax=Romanomermis culicivorax TaxID=13658 RepID=A0A915I6H0_ROMCU